MDEHTYKKQVNSSGFPFQLLVERLIKASLTMHRWNLLPPEHPWINHESGKGGFIDLILERHESWDVSGYMVIECKRIKSPGRLVFLSTDKSSENLDAYILLAQRQQNEKIFLSWIKSQPHPAMPLSAFCTVPGQSDKDTPMLERISVQLLDSVESLAVEEMWIKPQASIPGDPVQVVKRAVYFPIIVTNSELVVCQFGAMAVDLAEGELPDNAGEFKTVPFIRFQKSMPTRFTTEKTSTTLQQANIESQRTVFIIHAPSLPDLLRRWDY